MDPMGYNLKDSMFLLVTSPTKRTMEKKGEKKMDVSVVQ